MRARSSLNSLIAFLLLLMGCRGWEDSDQTFAVDTLSSGLVLVNNHPPGIWGHSFAHPVEELRIGSAMEATGHQFAAPSGIAVAEDGRIYVADIQKESISVFSTEGRLLQEFGGKGEGPGELHGASGILLGSDGDIWVREGRNNRYSRFAQDGRFIEVWPIPFISRSSPWKAATDRNGDLIDWGYLRPFVIRPDGSSGWNPRAGSRTEHVWWPVRIKASGEVDTLPPLRYEGDYLSSHPMIFRPNSATLEFHLDKGEMIWFASTRSYEIYQRSLYGDTTLMFSLDAEPQIETDEERQRIAREWLPGRTINPDEVHRERPLIARILTDEQGRVFVFPRLAGIEVGSAVDVFDTTGVLLGRAFLPTTLEMVPSPVVRHGAIYAITRDNLDVPYLTRIGLHFKRE